MGRIVERIDEPIQNELIKIFKAETERRPEVLARYHAYIKDPEHLFVLPDDARSKQPRRLSYDTLAEILEVFGFSYVDVYKIIGVQLHWWNDRAQRMCEVCDSLPPEIVTKFNQTAAESSPMFWRAKNVKKLQPTMRARLVFAQSHSGVHYSRKEVPEMIPVWKDRKLCQTLDTAVLPHVAEELEISLHWLLRLDETTTLLAKNPETESFMDTFGFLPAFVQNTYLYAMEDLKKELS